VQFRTVLTEHYGLREQKEANTVQLENTAQLKNAAQTNQAQANQAQANLKPCFQRSHGQQAAARIERDYLWSRPSCAAMSLRLGTSYAIGTGLVPV